MDITKKYTVFMNNGTMMTINAASFSWDDDGTVCFYDKEDFEAEDADMIAVFKQDILFGVSENIVFRASDEQLVLPKYVKESENKEC